MVIRGNSRGNARQLSHYLLAQKDNEHIRILDIDGQSNPTDKELHQAIFAMGVSAELTKSENGLYHAQINPAIGEDALMNDDHWLEAGDILGKQLGLENQRRAIVLHTKKGRTHAHVVWERYDYDKGKMVSDSFSRLAQDRARKEMEASFGHEQTPHRNKHRPELKASLSNLWHQTGTGAQFIKAANNNGYIIAEGSGRSPYIVVDENGRSFDLTRQLNGVKLKDVRQRLRHETMLGEKDAISLARKKMNDNKGGSGGTGKGKEQSSFTIKPAIMNEEQESKKTTSGKAANDNKQQQPKQDVIKQQFQDNKTDMGVNPKSQQSKQDITRQQFGDNKSSMGINPEKQQPKETTRSQFTDNKKSVTGQKTIQEKFAENKADKLDSDKQKEEKRRAEFKMKMQSMKNKQSKDKDKGMEMG